MTARCTAGEKSLPKAARGIGPPAARLSWRRYFTTAAAGRHGREPPPARLLPLPPTPVSGCSDAHLLHPRDETVVLATNTGRSGVFVDLAVVMIGARGLLNVATVGIGERCLSARPETRADAGQLLRGEQP